ncbi:MAG: VCBS repeat-containing protein, partial [bacterium]
MPFWLHFNVSLFVALIVCGTAPALSQRSSPPSVIPFSQSVIDQSNPRNPNCKAVGDIDGDGFLDALTASNVYTEGLFWYKYPAWTKYRIATGSFTTDMQTADIDGDGDLDVIIPKNGSAVTWYENPRPGGNPGVDQWNEHLIGFAANT